MADGIWLRKELQVHSSTPVLHIAFSVADYTEDITVTKIVLHLKEGLGYGRE